MTQKNLLDDKTKMKVNESRVIFTNPKTLKEESIDVSIFNKSICKQY